jgi:hypothetical protein
MPIMGMGPLQGPRSSSPASALIIFCQSLGKASCKFPGLRLTGTHSSSGCQVCMWVVAAVAPVVLECDACNLLLLAGRHHTCARYAPALTQQQTVSPPGGCPTSPQCMRRSWSKKKPWPTCLYCMKTKVRQHECGRASNLPTSSTECDLLLVHW